MWSIRGEQYNAASVGLEKLTKTNHTFILIALWFKNSLNIPQILITWEEPGYAFCTIRHDFISYTNSLK